MTRLSIIFVAVLLFALMLVARPLQSLDATQKKASSVVVITDQDNGKDIDLPAGDTLVVRLKSNPSTGYTWAIKRGPSILRLLKTSTKKTGQTAHGMGAPVIQEFRLTAMSAGLSALILEYRRAWEYTAGPAKTFSVQVNAR